MDSCLFCKIVRGEVPSTKVLEDEESIAFIDINPVVEGHLLLIPKTHIEWVQDVPDELLGSIFSKSKRLIHAMKEGLSCDYVQISIIGKDIPHFHIHLIPRMLDDSLHGWPTKNYKGDEIRTIAEKIKNAL